MTENEAIKEIEKWTSILMFTGQCTVETAEAQKMAIEALEEVQQYRAIGMPEECRAAMEKQVAISREIIDGKYFCPKCHNLAPYPMYCGCGQKLY